MNFSDIRAIIFGIFVADPQFLPMNQGGGKGFEETSSRSAIEEQLGQDSVARAS
jgi:hypothetical protein